MKYEGLLLSLLSAAVIAGPPEQPKPIQQPQPPVSNGAAPAALPPIEQNAAEQRVVAGRPVLIAPEQANALIAKFKASYPKLGSPRMVIFVNRELVDENSGLKLTARTEKTQSNRTELNSEFKRDPNAPQTAGSSAIPSASNVTIVGDISGHNHRAPGREDVQTKTEKVTHEDSYKLTEKSTATLADKQTVRDLERLFGRPLRMAGVSLADQRIASQLVSDNSGQGHTGADQARKDREALKNVADVAIEVLISSRQVTVPEVSGDKIYSVPDIQATAVRLADSRILGQAVSSDIIGKDRYAGNIVRNFDVREIAEATALALMEDMLLGVAD